MSTTPTAFRGGSVVEGVLAREHQRPGARGGARVVVSGTFAAVDEAPETNGVVERYNRCWRASRSWRIARRSTRARNTSDVKPCRVNVCPRNRVRHMLVVEHVED